MGITLLYLQHSRNMSSIMANNDKLRSNTKFNKKVNINISRMQPCGRMGFVLVKINSRKSYPNEAKRQSWLLYQNHHPSERYYMYNTKTKSNHQQRLDTGTIYQAKLL